VGTASIVNDWINSTSSLIGGTIVIASGFIAVMRWAHRGFKSVVRVGEKIDAIEKKVDKVVIEIATNGGTTSIKDVVGILKTGQVEMFAAINRIEAMYLASLEMTGKAYWLSDPDGRCSYASPKLAHMMGTIPEKIIGWGWASYVDPKDADRVKRRWDLAVAEQREFKEDYGYVHEDGTVIQITGRAIPVIHAQTKRAIGMIGWAEQKGLI